MKKALYICLVIILIELIAAAWLFPALSDVIPLHWNIRGQIDTTGENWAVFLLPVVSLAAILIVYSAFSVGIRTDKNIQQARRIFPIFLIIVKLVLSTIFIYLCCLYMSGENGFNLAVIIIPLACLLICAGVMVIKLISIILEVM